MAQALPESWRRRIAEYFRGNDSPSPPLSDDQSLSVTILDNTLPVTVSSVELAKFSSQTSSDFARFDDEVSAQGGKSTNPPQEDAAARLAESTMVNVNDMWGGIVAPAAASGGHVPLTTSEGQHVWSLGPMQSNPLWHVGSSAVNAAAEVDTAPANAELTLRAHVLALEHTVLQNEHVIEQKEQLVQLQERIIRERDEEIRLLKQLVLSD